MCKRCPLLQSGPFLSFQSSCAFQLPTTQSQRCQHSCSGSQRKKDPQRRLVLVIPCLSSKLVQNVFHHAPSRYRVPPPNPCRLVEKILRFLCPLLDTGAVFHHRAWTLNLAKCLAQAIRSFRLWDHHLNAVRPCVAHMVEPFPISHQQLRYRFGLKF